MWRTILKCEKSPTKDQNEPTNTVNPTVNPWPGAHAQHHQSRSSQRTQSIDVSPMNRMKAAFFSRGLNQGHDMCKKRACTCTGSEHSKEANPLNSLGGRLGTDPASVYCIVLYCIVLLRNRRAQYNLTRTAVHNMSLSYARRSATIQYNTIHWYLVTEGHSVTNKTSSVPVPPVPKNTSSTKKCLSLSLSISRPPLPPFRTSLALIHTTGWTTVNRGDGNLAGNSDTGKTMKKTQNKNIK